MTKKKSEIDVGQDYGADDVKDRETVPGQEESTCVPIESVPVHQGVEIFSLQESSKYEWYQIDEPSLPLLAQIEPTLRKKFLKLGLLPGPRRYELGRFQLHQDHLAVFEAIPALNEVSYTEVLESPSDSASQSEDDTRDLPPISAFLKMTDKNDPVPEILIELDDRSDDENVVRLLQDRDIVDSLDPVGSQRAKFELEPAPAAGAINTCFHGGIHVFRDNFCSSGGISFCDSGANKTPLVRTSGKSKRYHSFSRVAACFGTVQVYHYYQAWWWGWKWFRKSPPFEPAQQLIGSGQVKPRTINGGAKRRRKIEVSQWSHESSLYFRAFTRFF